MFAPVTCITSILRLESLYVISVSRASNNLIMSSLTKVRSAQKTSPGRTL